VFWKIRYVSLGLHDIVLTLVSACGMQISDSEEVLIRKALRYGSAMSKRETLQDAWVLLHFALVQDAAN
jgi:hypothetical protein